MVLILESQPISQRRASTTLAVDEGLMKRMVKHLTALGLIHKEASAKDKRVKELTLTEDGKELLDYGLSQVEKWWDSIAPDLKDIDINHLGRELFDISRVVLSDRHQIPLKNDVVDPKVKK
nr:winged helix DNA-binding protein [Secundilactobacillus angelensis]